MPAPTQATTLVRGQKRSHAGMDGRTLGVLGGGQLGRMMAEAAHRVGIALLPLDPGGMMSPAGQVAGQAVQGSFKDPAKIRELASKADVLTVEIEHVECGTLEELEKEGVEIQPSPACIRLIQDKLVQKRHFEACGVPLGPFLDTPDEEAARRAGEISRGCVRGFQEPRRGGLLRREVVQLRARG